MKEGVKAMLFELLTEKEKEMMLNYIDAYAGGRSEDQNSLDYILRYWEKNKQDLFKLLGNKLIYSVPYSGREPEERLILKVKDAISGYGTNKAISHLYDKLYNAIHYTTALADGTPFTIGNHLRDDLSSLYNDLMNAKAIVENKYAGPTRKFTLNNGKVYQFQNGARAVKLIGKLCEILGISQEYFEEFRLLQSQIVNQKNVKGTLCFSIHPLDFMTMSDNASNWTSCMSWQDEGCYRRGTVEMMNSPVVIVVYLKDDKEDMPMGRYNHWNNKKWRQLFVISDKLATSVKAYPYANEDLSCTALKIINQLCDNRYHDTIYKFNERSNEKALNSIDGKSTFKVNQLRFYTDAMYNDFYTTTHYALFNKSIDGNEGITSELNYSGPGVCMRCGTDYDDFNSESSLVCSDCSNEFYCDSCGEWFDKSEMREGPDGQLYCECCYNDLFAYFELTDQDEVCDLPDSVYIVPDEFKEFLESKETTTDAKFNLFNMCPYFDYNYNQIDSSYILSKYLVDNEIHEQTFYERGLYYGGYSTRYYVYVSQIGNQLYKVANGGEFDYYTSNEELMEALQRVVLDD